jgi:hypothetical protein
MGKEEGRAVGNQKIVHYKQQQSVSYLSLWEVSWKKGGTEGAVIRHHSISMGVS